MGARTAQIVFAAFIATGFILEARERRTRVTAATWLPLLWMTICASRSVAQWLSVGNYQTFYTGEVDYVQANLSGSPIDQVVLTLTIVMGLVVVYKRRAAAAIIKRNKSLLIFVVYLGLTVLWSDTLAASFRRWVRLFGHFVMAGVLMSEPASTESVRSMFRRCAYLLVPLSVLFIKYFPNIGVLYTRRGGMLWIGAAVMKNGLGHLALVFTFLIAWKIITGRRRDEAFKLWTTSYDLVVLLMGLWLLRGNELASSSAAFGCLIVGLTLAIGSRLPVMKRNFGNAGVLILAAAGVFVALESTFGVVEIIVVALGRNMTFTDRVPLWNALVDFGLQRPVFGYGYSGFWTSARMAAIAIRAGDFSQCHNGYMEIFMEGGLIAIGLLTVLLVSVFRKIQRNGLIDYEYGVLQLCLFAIILLANVTESSFARERDLLSFVFFVIAMNHGSATTLSGGDLQGEERRTSGASQFLPRMNNGWSRALRPQSMGHLVPTR